MMRRHFQLGLAAAALAAMTASAAAWATPASAIQMTLQSGGVTVQGLNIYPTSNAAGYSNPNFMGWDIYAGFTGNSNAPLISPFGIDLGGTVAACMNSAGCAPLTVSISDIGFTSPVTSFNSTLSDTQTGTGSVSQQAYYDLGNTYFGTTGTIVGSSNPLMLSGSGSTYGFGGGPAAGDTSPYSLTMIDTFSSSCTSNGCASFSIDGNIAGNVPEPGTLALFGAGLLGFAVVASRRRRAQQRR